MVHLSESGAEFEEMLLKMKGSLLAYDALVYFQALKYGKIIVWLLYQIIILKYEFLKMKIGSIFDQQNSIQGEEKNKKHRY